MTEQFEECPACAAKTGSPILCDACLVRRAKWEKGEREPDPNKFEEIDATPDRCPFCGGDIVCYLQPHTQAHLGNDPKPLEEYQCTEDHCGMSFWV